MQTETPSKSKAMKKTTTLLNFAFTMSLAFTLASCGLSNKTLSQYDDMYYSPSSARRQAALDKKKSQQETPPESLTENQTGNSLQNQSNYNSNSNGNNTVINNYYGSDSRLNYGGYFNRFGTGYYSTPRTGISVMIGMGSMYNPYSPGYSFWTGYNNFGMGYGSGFYNPYYSYNPYSMYNPYYMNPYYNYNTYGDPYTDRKSVV